MHPGMSVAFKMKHSPFSASFAVFHTIVPVLSGPERLGSAGGHPLGGGEA